VKIFDKSPFGWMQGNVTANEIWKEIEALKQVCFYKVNRVTSGYPTSFGIYSVDEGINVKIEQIEKKLDRLIEHLGLEEHKPSCEKQFRAKKYDRS